MTALEAGLKRLSARALSRGELRQRLASRFSSTEVEAALDRIAELGYLDDRRLAFDRAEDALANGRGPLLIAAGLSAAHIEEAILKETLAGLASRVEQACLDLLQAKLGASPDPRALVRAKRLVLGRGFDEEMVERLLRKHWPRAMLSAT
jgi:SOS response regulatory protein OraA/RecX